MKEASPFSSAMREAVRETVAGYARADEYLRAERMARLAHMTDEQARAIFDQLVEAGVRYEPPDEEREAYELWRIESTLVVRRAMQRLAESQGWL
ncbi:MAG: hypothetical protein ACRDHL_05235 [Candidatus Promineifilaceae bacterium]